MFDQNCVDGIDGTEYEATYGANYGIKKENFLVMAIRIPKYS